MNMVILVAMAGTAFLLATPFVVNAGRRLVPAKPKVMAQDIGARVSVLSEIRHGYYRVNHQGAEWEAFIVDSYPLTRPTVLTVVGVEGLRLKCKLDLN